MIDNDNKDLFEEEIEDNAPDNTQVFDTSDNEIDDDGDNNPNGNNKKKMLIPIIIACIVILSALIFVLLNGNGTKNPNVTPTPTPTPTTTVDTDKWAEDIALWDKNYKINKDYVAEIRFESGIIDLPVVQLANTDEGYTKYIRTDWETMKHDEEGSIFADPYSDLETSQNIVLYGHYVYPSYDASGTHKFTPLVKLIEKDNYEANKYIYLILKDEVRKYEIAHVYHVQLDSTHTNILDQDLLYMRPDFTSSQLTAYLNKVKKSEFYSTGVEIKDGDKMLTLQTCVQNRDDLREIVICKEIEVTKIR